MMSKIKSASAKLPTILIFGLGSYGTGSGTAAAFYYARQGYPVIVTDRQPAKQLNLTTLKQLRHFRNVTLVLGKHRVRDIRQADLIVRNPGVSRHFTKPTTNDIGIFIAEVRQRFGDQVKLVGITGTRGKSTTTALIGHILQAQFGSRRVHIGGNIGRSPLTFIQKIKAGDIIVLELSSWLLRDLHQPAFDVAVVTNLLRDHMNYYPSMQLYQRDKERIFLGQTAKQFAVVNQDDVRVRRMVKHSAAQIKWFTAKSLAKTKLLGKHNEYNIGAAWQVGKIFGLSNQTLTKAMQSFQPLADRLEIIRHYQGRVFVNDTTATTPDATIAALLAFKKKVILIAGGNAKRLSLAALKKLIPQQVKQLILLPGNANHDFPPGLAVTTMQQAVRTAWHLSKSGDVILLSPGVTWLPLMNEFERGKQFVRAVKLIR